MSASRTSPLRSPQHLNINSHHLNILSYNHIPTAQTTATLSTPTPQGCATTYAPQEWQRTTHSPPPPSAPLAPSASSPAPIPPQQSRPVPDPTPPTTAPPLPPPAAPAPAPTATDEDEDYDPETTPCLTPLRAAKEPSSRLGRLMHYGSLVARLAWGAAGQHISPSSCSGYENAFIGEAHLRRLVEKLSTMRGAVLKMGHFMSIQDSNMFPPELEEVLLRVQNSANFMPKWQMEKAMHEDLRPD
ncbi:hypothetical protein CF326_g7762 [Tilletia indica]|nr:hypothetical protein CF326_g7762 [Tilletia indica]